MDMGAALLGANDKSAAVPVLRPCAVVSALKPDLGASAEQQRPAQRVGELPRPRAVLGAVERADLALIAGSRQQCGRIVGAQPPEVGVGIDVVRIEVWQQSNRRPG